MGGKGYLLLPAKDEEAAIGDLVRRGIAAGMRVVVCDDGSEDGTARKARAAGALVLSHPRNLGLAEAIRTLLNWAADHLEDPDWAVTMDADGTMAPEDALLLADHLGKAPIVIGSRFAPGGKEEGVPLFRKLLSRGASAYFRLMAGLPVKDYTSGFRAYRAGFLKAYRKRFPAWFDAPGFSAQTELLLRAGLLMEAQVVEVGLPFRYDRKEGPSKMRVLRTVREYLRLGLLAAEWRAGKKAAPKGSQPLPREE